LARCDNFRTSVNFQLPDIFVFVGAINVFETRITPVMCRPNFDLSNRNGRFHFMADLRNHRALLEVAVKSRTGQFPQKDLNA